MQLGLNQKQPHNMVASQNHKSKIIDSRQRAVCHTQSAHLLSQSNSRYLTNNTKFFF